MIASELWCKGRKLLFEFGRLNDRSRTQPHLFHELGVGRRQFASRPQKVVVIDLRSVVVAQKVIRQWNRRTETLERRIDEARVSQVLQPNHSHGNGLIMLRPFRLGQIVHDGIVDMAVGGRSCPRGVGNVVVVVGTTGSISRRRSSVVSFGIDAKDTATKKSIAVGFRGRRRSFWVMILMRTFPFGTSAISACVLLGFSSIHGTGCQGTVVGMTLIVGQN